jgi:hypothetical protein
MPATLPQNSTNRELFTRERRRTRLQNFLQTLESEPLKSQCSPEPFHPAKSAARTASASRTVLSAAR